jgi:hypothetical protein
MSTKAFRALMLMVCAAVTVPALADDCVAAKSAMLDTGHRPVSVTSTTTDAQGKQKVTRTVQTVDNKYVQTADGKWYSMGIAIKDLNDNTKTAKFTCRRTGTDNVNGEPAAVYEVHMDDNGTIVEQKIWVSAKNLILKAEGSVNGVRYSSVYDFSHVAPPANATAMGAH